MRPTARAGKVTTVTATDPFTPSAKDAAEWGARLALLRGAKYLTDDGEVLTAQEYKRESESLSAALRQYIERHGDFDVEGVGRLYLQDRRSVSYDVKAIAENERAHFEELVELDVLNIDSTKAKAHADRLWWLKALAIVGGSSALMIEKDR